MAASRYSRYWSISVLNEAYIRATVTARMLRSSSFSQSVVLPSGLTGNCEWHWPWGIGHCGFSIGGYGSTGITGTMGTLGCGVGVGVGVSVGAIGPIIGLLVGVGVSVGGGTGVSVGGGGGDTSVGGIGVAGVVGATVGIGHPRSR